MKNLLRWILSSLLLISTALAVEPNAVVTIYNSNLGLVQEERTLSLERGEQTISITDVASRIRPATVHLNADNSNAFRLLEQNYQYDLVNTNKVFDKYIGNQISLLTESDETRTGQLLSRDGSSLILQTEDGAILVINASHVKEYQFPSLPQGMFLRPTLQWIIDSNSRGDRSVELSYLADGLNWNAEYILNLREDDSNGVLSSWVTLENNSGATYEDATVKLVAGDLNLVEEQQQIRPTEVLAMARAADQPAVTERGVFEYHLYEIEFPTTLRQNSMKQVTLRQPTEIEYQRVYRFEHREREAVEQENVDVGITFQNTSRNNLGIPLPAGVVRLMQEDVDGGEILVGEDRMQHTPRDEEIRLTAGKSFDIVGDRQVSAYERRGSDFERWTVTLSLRNHKDESVTIEVIEHFYGDWEITEQSSSSVREDATTARFTVDVPARDERELEYTVERTF